MNKIRIVTEKDRCRLNIIAKKILEPLYGDQKKLLINGLQVKDLKHLLFQ